MLEKHLVVGHLFPENVVETEGLAGSARAEDRGVNEREDSQRHDGGRCNQHAMNKGNDVCSERPGNPSRCASFDGPQVRRAHHHAHPETQLDDRERLDNVEKRLRQLELKVG